MMTSSRRKLQSIGLAFCLIIANLTPFAATSAQEEDGGISVGDVFDSMRSAFYEFLTGGAVDATDPDIRAKIDEMDAAVQSYWNSMDKSAEKTAIWPELPTSTSSYNITLTYQRLAVMAVAYRTGGSSFHNNVSLRDDIIGAMEWMYANRYNESVSPWGNWWDWQIGAPIEINKVLTLLYDEMDAALIGNYADALRMHVPARASANPGDANDLWLLFNRLVAGVIEKDAAAVADVMGTLESDWFQYTNGRNGFHRDGSYIMHDYYPYVGSYGTSAIETLAKVAYIVNGTPYEISEANLRLTARWIQDSYAPFIYKGAMMDMVRGRTIARELEGDHLIGHVVIRSIFLISQVAPQDIATELQSMVKYWVKEDTSRSIYEGADTINNNNSVFFIARIKALMNDRSVKPMREPVGFAAFPAMDRFVQLRPGYAFGISMHSDRIANYESINNENRKGWHTADGMTYLYNGDLAQFSGEFWPTVDAYRLPGTTVERETTIPAGMFNGGDWVGGAGLDEYGVAGMLLKPSGQTLSAKKSWFLFDDEIVALGSDISANDGKAVETIVENRKLSASGGGTLTVDGVQKPSAVGWAESMPNVQWAHLEGAVKDADIGYYFPSGATVSGLREERSGRWSDLAGGSSAELTARYLSLSIDHGLNPTAASYAYVLLPGKTPQHVRNYSRKPDISILENSSEAHAVKENRLNIVGVNFWNDAVKTVDFVTSDKKASVLVRDSASEIALSVADPTHKNNGVIHLELDRSAQGILELDPHIEVTRLSPTIQLTVHTKGLQGTAVKARFSKHRLAPKVTGVAVEPAEADVAIGESVTLTAVVQPDRAPNKFAKWSSSDPEVATVVGGIVTGHKAGTAVITATTYDGGYTASATVHVVEKNFALGKRTVESMRSSAPGDALLLPENAVDGDYATRWASHRSDNQWLYIDLGRPYVINRVKLYWEYGYGKVYRIEVADDPDGEWTTVYAVSNGDGGLDDLTFADVKTRYVRMYGVTRSTIYSFSLWEFEVYGPDDVIVDYVPVDDIAVAAGTPLEQVGLPDEITVIRNNGKRQPVGVVWDTSTLDLTTPGVYELTGVVEQTEWVPVVKVIVQ